ncbi:glycosyltransferase family 2 protein [Yunchengibacter salinarum]|uniref:glycosyltransferase family 2 protein n=1 Tax=Yunchengibacter salinarum TaxID=3133399 RepID=UPI0035B63EF6
MKNGNGKSDNLLSILIPNHNYGAYVGETIRSVLTQDYSPIELIVVDDGSTDDSVAEIEKALAESGHLYRVKFVPLKKNAGKLAAINAVLDEVHGAFMITLDADDILVKDYCSRCMREFRIAQARDPKLGFVYSDCNLMDKYGEVIDRGRSTGFDAGLLERFSYVPEPALVVTDAFMEVTPFDETIRVATKHHKWIRMVANGWTGHHIPEPLFYYRMHDQNLSGIGKRVTNEVENGERGERILSGYWTTAHA